MESAAKRLLAQISCCIIATLSVINLFISKL